MFTASRMFEVLGLLYLHQLFSSVTVTAELPPPCKVAFVSENFRHLLIWEAGGPGSDATSYTVEYSAFTNGDVWQATQNCSRISIQMCNLTDELGKYSESFFVRVKAVTEAEESNWTITEEFVPRRDTKLLPVNVRLAAGNGGFKINFDPATLPTIIKNTGVDSLFEIFGPLHYHIIIAKNGEIEKYRDLQGSVDEQSISEMVENVEASTNYCITIKIFSSKEKPSDPSEKRCIVTHPAKNTEESLSMWMIISFCLLFVGLLLFIITLYTGGYLGYLTKYVPQALNNLKQVNHVYYYQDVEENISTLSHIALKLNYLNEKKMDIQEDSGTELISSDEEDGYEQHSLPVQFQKNAVETDIASFEPFDNQPSDEFTEKFCTHPDDCQIFTTEEIHVECEGSETKSQILTDSELNSSAAADVDIPHVPLCSVQIEDADCFSIPLSTLQLCDQENIDQLLNKQEIDLTQKENLTDALVCSLYDSHHTKAPGLCDVSTNLLHSQMFHSHYIRH